MISIGWHLKDDGFWHADAEIDMEKEEAMVDIRPTYCPFPAVRGKGVSRWRNYAVAFALEDLAVEIVKASQEGKK